VSHYWCKGALTGFFLKYRTGDNLMVPYNHRTDAATPSVQNL
jgi:hypothetical protein